MDPLYIVLIAVGLVLIMIIGMYNGLISKRNQVDNAFASIDVMLKKRSDLIPQLVNVVKGYAKHEDALFEKVARLRAEAKKSGLNTDDRVDVENQITESMSQLVWVSESYPDLKANQNFLNLQRNISEMEEQLSAARRAFNASVNDYNNGIEKFPSNIIAGMMSFKRKPFFELPKTSRADFETAPEINV